MARKQKEMKWYHAEKSKLAHEAGLHLRELSDFARGTRNFSPAKAAQLEEASARVLGEARRIPATCWLRIPGSEHPLITNYFKE